MAHTLEEHLKNPLGNSPFAGRLVPSVDTVMTGREHGKPVNGTATTRVEGLPVVRRSVQVSAGVPDTTPAPVAAARASRDGVGGVCALGPLDDRGRVNAAKALHALGWDTGTALSVTPRGQAATAHWPTRPEAARRGVSIG